VQRRLLVLLVLGLKCEGLGAMAIGAVLGTALGVAMFIRTWAAGAYPVYGPWLLVQRRNSFAAAHRMPQDFGCGPLELYPTVKDLITICMAE
jgi:hypothetical protein